MRILISILFVIISFCSCRTTNLVYISVLKPAPVTIPPYIKNVGVINRSVVSDANKAVDVVDKVFSMEGVNLDKEGSNATIIGVTDELFKNNRFTNVTAFNSIDLRTTVPGLYSAPLPWETINQICRDNKVDALFVLELFDTDSKVSYAAVPITIKTPLGNIPGIEHHANMLTTVKTGWRIYDPASKNILDEYSIARDITFSGKGINPVAAAGAILDRKEAVKEVGNKAGKDYALRIIPYWIRVSRDYYVKGTDNFKIAKRKAQTGNWNGAAELWQRETGNTSIKISGRACYNMAIISEINGDLDKAIEWAQKSYENCNNRLALNYIRILKNRKVSDNVLKDQQSE
ncbi:hypothetical protein GO495_30025 [Chitinophaga oryziterrae]|uniref:Uncharacterized protein n=1 Tax=Chitinophaga oryziterrae TaxID=1031224 RepID=A0A6N8JI23_9BACT|nr:DUF6340 family protein [Chitinophaga oryziterrae]MVT44867.1 hypothetical protein [Chitinophaga oryziterrae]